jgi:predicted phosphodiesterase
MPQYRRKINALAGLGIAALLLGALALIVQQDAISLLALLVGLAAIAVPAMLVVYLTVTSAQESPETPPLLLIADGAGIHGYSELVLTWRSASPTVNEVTFEGDGVTWKAFDEQPPAHRHALRLRYLTPGVRYQWRLNDGPAHSILTPGDAAFHFAASGDCHFGRSMGTVLQQGNAGATQSILNYVANAADPFHAFFALGDLVNLGMYDQQWQAALAAFAQPSYSVPLRAIMGNHDALGDGGAHFRSYLCPPELRATARPHLYGRMDFWRVHVLMLKMLWGAESFSQQQRDWFEREVDTIPPGDWRIVLMHAPAYTSGNAWDGKNWYDPEDMVQQVSPLLEKHRVNLVISGHNHQLEFLEKNGVAYVVAGGFGGRPERACRHISPASQWLACQTHGFVDVAVYDTQARVIFRDENGKEMSGFTVHADEHGRSRG